VLDVAGHFIELEGTSKKHPVTGKLPDPDKMYGISKQPPSVSILLLGGALCNDASLTPDLETGRFLPTGDPTEGALLVAAEQAGLNRNHLEEELPRVAEVPFDSVRKRMTTVHRLSENRKGLLEEIPRVMELPMIQELDRPYLAITKGSLDGLLEISTQIWVEDKPEPLNEYWMGRIMSDHDRLAQKGMRVLGLAVKALDKLPEKVDAQIERELTLVGLFGMIDPPRPEVKSAIKLCKAAGIRPIMITGDHPLTARFIAYELGITENERVKTGQDLDRMSTEELNDAIDDVSVFARVTPEHKLRIVEILQDKNNIVAMTGDGVNDSPALKKADIGVAMGITGTDDDNFATIVAAVEEGRAIYDNLRRFVKFSIAGNLGKVLVMLLAPFMGIAVALLPLQLLWLNLLTDGLLGLGLGMEPASIHVMAHPPRKKDENFLSTPLIWYVSLVGLLIGVIALILAYIYFQPESDSLTWQTMIFTALAFMQLGQALASRSDDVSMFEIGWLSNPVLLVMSLIVFFSQVMVIYVPFFQDFFHIEALSLMEMLICIGLGVLVFVVLEGAKMLQPKTSLEQVTALSS
jgi:Ca2+-transporting ATPase